MTPDDVTVLLDARDWRDLAVRLGGELTWALGADTRGWLVRMAFGSYDRASEAVARLNVAAVKRKARGEVPLLPGL